MRRARRPGVSLDPANCVTRGVAHVQPHAVRRNAPRRGVRGRRADSVRRTGRAGLPAHGRHRQRIQGDATDCVIAGVGHIDIRAVGGQGVWSVKARVQADAVGAAGRIKRAGDGRDETRRDTNFANGLIRDEIRDVQIRAVGRNSERTVELSRPAGAVLVSVGIRHSSERCHGGGRQIDATN